MKASYFWAATLVILFLALLAGGLVLYWRYPRSPSLEIVLPSPAPAPSPSIEVSPSPQKIDINRAEPWLLEALPGIGPSLAEAIVRYRQGEKGPFRTPQDIQKVPGIGVETYQKIKDLITVGE